MKNKRSRPEEKTLCVIAWVSEDGAGYQWYTSQVEGGAAVQEILQAPDSWQGCRFLFFEVHAPLDAPDIEIRNAIHHVLSQVPFEDFMEVSAEMTPFQHGEQD